MRRLPLLVLLLSVGVEPAAASSDRAWLQLQQRAERACVAAAGYRRPRVSNPIVFSDRSGEVALLVTGILERPRGGQLPVTSLCLYDRRSGRVEVQEAEGWRDQPR